MSWDNLAKALYDELAEDIGTDQWGMSVHDRQWWNDLADEVREFARGWDPHVEVEGYVPEVIGPDGHTYRMVDIPVVDGVATLPDGATVQSTAHVVRVPVLVEPAAP